VKPPAHVTDAHLSGASDYDRHIGKRLRETFVEGRRVSSRRAQAEPGPATELTEENDHERTKDSGPQDFGDRGTLHYVDRRCFRPGDVPDDPEPEERPAGRIAQGVRSGQLTRGETRNVESRERSVNREEHAMRRADGGHLTGGDKAALTRRQNNISRSISKDKHNARVR
jgi:hypothetical protein